MTFGNATLVDYPCAQVHFLLYSAVYWYQNCLSRFDDFGWASGRFPRGAAEMA